MKEIWLAFALSKLVVTDRLHGMIFCVITGTPCLAIDSSNARVSRFYTAWLQDIGHVRLFPRYDPVEFSESAESLMRPSPDLGTTRSLRSEVIHRLKSVVETPTDPRNWNSYVPPEGRGPCYLGMIDRVMISVHETWPAECGLPHVRELLVCYSRTS